MSWAYVPQRTKRIEMCSDWVRYLHHRQTDGPTTKTQYKATLQASSLIYTELYESVAIQMQLPWYTAPICDLGYVDRHVYIWSACVHDLSLH